MTKIIQEQVKIMAKAFPSQRPDYALQSSFKEASTEGSWDFQVFSTPEVGASSQATRKVVLSEWSAELTVNWNSQAASSSARDPNRQGGKPFTPKKKARPPKGAGQ